MKPQILSIIPNENAGNLFLEAAKAIDDVQLYVKHATLQDAVVLANSFEKDFDVIIARGETARMIRSKVSIPVVELEIATHEVLSAIRQAEALKEPFAVVGFSSLTSRAQRLSSLLSLNLNIYTVFNNDDVPAMFDNIENAGFHVIVTGTGFSRYTLDHSFTVISIMTTMPSIESVVLQAAELGRTIVRNKKKNIILEKILSSEEERHIITDKGGSVIFDNTGEEALPPLCRKLLLSGRERQSSERSIGDSIWKIEPEEFEADDEKFTNFTVTRKSINAVKQNGRIRIYSASEAEEAFLSHFPHFSDISYASTNQAEMERISNAKSPIILFGEKGTGKRQMAALIYLRGRNRSHMYYTLDMKDLSTRQWSALTESSDSPFAMRDTTLYISGLESVDASRLSALESFIADSGLIGRVKLIFSAETLPNVPLSSDLIAFMNRTGAISKEIKPLRQRRSELMALSNIYINSFDAEYCRNIVGLTPEAEALFISYQWPGNLDQFKRVVSELVLASPSVYIPEDLTQKILEREKKFLTTAAELSSVLDINKTMGEIEKDIARAVVAKCNGNRTRAAEKLGICRTTLWRLLEN